MKNIIVLLLLILISQKSMAHSSPDNHSSRDKSLRSGNINSVYPGHNKVIMTFDDGPNPNATPQILKTLKEHNVKATFFVLGKLAKRYPDIMKAIEMDGHIIANHSYEHKNIGKMVFRLKKKLKKSFFEAHDAIRPYINANDPTFFRAPYGSWKKKATKIINKTAVGKNYIGPVLWDIGGDITKNSDGVYTEAADWGCWSRGMTVDQCLEGYVNKTDKKEGGVILMHDIHAKSAQMLVKLLPALKSKGYEFMNLDEVGLTK